jgi:hypothetical protein
MPIAFLRVRLANQMNLDSKSYRPSHLSLRFTNRPLPKTTFTFRPKEKYCTKYTLNTPLTSTPLTSTSATTAHRNSPMTNALLQNLLQEGNCCKPQSRNVGYALLRLRSATTVHRTSAPLISAPLNHRSITYFDSAHHTVLRLRSVQRFDEFSCRET